MEGEFGCFWRYFTICAHVYMMAFKAWVGILKHGVSMRGNGEFSP